MKLFIVTFCFMVALAVATCLAMTLTVLGVEHGAPTGFTVFMSAFTGLAGYLTVMLPIAFYRAHSK